METNVFAIMLVENSAVSTVFTVMGLQQHLFCYYAYKSGWEYL